ncbi:hypothetical protein KY46_01450 [Photobacterium halotolerans]|uniref:Uncharacterized protein n=1 Tax=Photobacterium halotolerans TaxID=265726 RepID=A0A0F5VJ20_9GAMM|nr:hypothetical protein KY46_01450 [Photobacterium halotolerans]
MDTGHKVKIIHLPNEKNEQKNRLKNLKRATCKGAISLKCGLIFRCNENVCVTVVTGVVFFVRMRKNANYPALT